MTKLILGDCKDSLKKFPDNYFHSVVCDPPYGLEFMGKEWDRLTAPTGGATFTQDGMGKGFKALPSYSGSPNPICRNCKGSQRGNDRKGFKRCRCDNPDFPNLKIKQAKAMQEWHLAWVTEVLRVLRPGGILLAFGGSRTSHRLACAIEDAGFEIRDSIIWMYGSGFPKSLNVGKAIDKAAGAKREVVGRRTDGRYAYGFEGTANRPTGAQADTVDAKRIGGFVSDKAIITAPATDDAATWDGWGTALKPAHEPIVMARKPLSESTVAKNVLRWGTGALNIDASRISPTGERLGGGGEKKATFKKSEGWSRPWMQDEKHVKQHAQKVIDNVEHASALGRWPANLVLVHHDDCKEVGTKKIKGHKGYPNGPGGFYSKEYQENSQVTADWNQFSTKEHDKPWKGHADEHGNETIPDWDCHPECPVRVLDEQSGDRPSTMTGAKEGKDYTSKARSSGLFGHMKQGNLYSDSGGASRFFYQAKASNRERFFLCKDCGVVGNKRKLHTDHNIVFHPTQKPLALMSYLVRMVTPPGGRVLDPFMGSGTTVVAATTDGFQATGIEKEQDYVTIARSRLKAAEPIKPLAGLEV